MLFLYSLAFPAVWMACSLLLSMLVPGRSLGTLGSALIIVIGASFISWLFVRRHGRDFTTPEYWTIICLCIAWAFVLELCALYFLISQSAAPDTSARTLSVVIAITLSLNTLFVWLAFRNFGRRVIRAYLAKRDVSKA